MHACLLRKNMKKLNPILAFFICFIPWNCHSLNMKKFDERIYREALDYNPKFAESFYCWKIPKKTFLEFLEIYKDRPIRSNEGGMRSHGNFFLWYLLKDIKPSLVIESGVFRGQSTWIIEQAAPNAKIIAIDPEPKPREKKYICKKAQYLVEDFSQLVLDKNQEGLVAAFFDDHQNAFERVVQAYDKGIKYLIFDDNYPAFNYPHKGSHLTLSDCFELEEHKDKAEMLKKIVKFYYVMPQIVGKTMRNESDSQKIEITNIPAIWPSLKEVDPSMRKAMKVFYKDSPAYQYITYVELY